MRDRLIELILNVPKMPIIINGRASGKVYQTAENIADRLIANGVIVPPCKVGDTVYYFSCRPFNLALRANTIYEATVVRIVTNRLTTSLVIQIHNEYGVTEVPDITYFGKTVFLSREDAESALEEAQKCSTT